MKLIKTEPDHYDPDNPEHCVDYHFIYGKGVNELYAYCTPEMELID